MGGKYRIGRQLVDFMQPLITSCKGYIEPFIGGANVMSYVQHKNRIGSDIHLPLINMWKAVQNGWEPPKANLPKSEYLRLKEAQDPSDPLTAFVGFGCCFGGSYYASYTIGKTRNYALNARNSILAKNIKGVSLKCCSYEKYKVSGYFIYCDPPYKGTSIYRGTGEFDHETFWSWAREASENNVLLVSEYQAPEDFSSVLEIQTKTDMLTVNGKAVRIEKLFCLSVKKEQFELERLLALYRGTGG